MRKRAVLAAMLAVLAAPAFAGVSVDYVEPTGFTDARLYYGFGRKPDAFVLRDLRQHLEKVGQRYLPADQSLKVEILDIDLAGYFSPVGRAGQYLRIMTEGTWPRIKLRYTLEKNGEVVGSAEDFVTDHDYLQQIGLTNTSDVLRYEKRMLTDWFRRRFEAH